ncbi:MAG: GNAT family N-acetyltransferase [Chloroflexota bacterium]
MIEPFDPDRYLPNLQTLINRHLEAVIPGWALPAQAILQHLSRNHHEPIIDPWVIERKTLCAVENGRLLAAAHLLRYGDSENVGDWYKNVGDVTWIFVEPDDVEVGAALLDAARQQMIAWGVKSVNFFDNGLPVTLISGLPDCWPHIAQLLVNAGFEPMHPRKEAIFGGWLRDIPAPGKSPIPNLTVRRMIQDTNVAFVGFIHNEKIGWCEITADLSAGGDSPALRGWAELSEIFIDDAWRSQGVGAWLLQHAVEWLRLAGCDRIALSVDSEDEARGAGRFYQRFGWNAISRMEVGWGYSIIPTPYAFGSPPHFVSGDDSV